MNLDRAYPLKVSELAKINAGSRKVFEEFASELGVSFDDIQGMTFKDLVATLRNKRWHGLAINRKKT